MVDLRTAPPPQPPPRPPSPYRRSRGRFIGLLVLLAVGVGAVVFLVVNAGDDAPPSEFVTSPTPTTAPPTTLDPETATKAEIEDVHRRASEIAVEVASDPNGQPDDPRLAQYKKGTALAAAQLGIRRLRGDGHVLNVSRLERNPRVVKLGPETAVVEDCSIDVSSIVDEQSGEVIEPAGPPEPKLVVASYEFIDGRWMQSSFKYTREPCTLPGS